MHAGRIEAVLQQRRELGRAAQAVAVCTVGLRVAHEVRIAHVHAEVRELHVRLLPLDHAVGVVAQQQHGQIRQAWQSEFLRVHQEAAVTGHGVTLRCGYDLGCVADGSRRHGRQRVVEQQGIGLARER